MPINDLVIDRLDNLLPKLMDEVDLDMWLVINREYGEDKLFYTLVPQPTFAARRTTLLVFSKNDDGSVERFDLQAYTDGTSGMDPPVIAAGDASVYDSVDMATALETQISFYTRSVANKCLNRHGLTPFFTKHNPVSCRK